MRQMINPPERSMFIRSIPNEVDLYKHPDYRIYYYYDKKDGTWWRLSDTPRFSM